MMRTICTLGGLSLVFVGACAPSLSDSDGADSGGASSGTTHPKTTSASTSVSNGGASSTGTTTLVTTGTSVSASSGSEMSTTATGQGGQGGAPPPPCLNTCSPDYLSVVDCHGNTVSTCADAEACAPSSVTCTQACAASKEITHSTGCEYYATNMDQYTGGACFAVLVSNTWSKPAHLSVDYKGQALNVASFTAIPNGHGPSLTYGAYDASAGIAPGGAAIVFLAGDPSSSVPCPLPAAVPTGSQLIGATGISNSFHVTADVPVAAYQINPYGGGSAAVTGASLLLPTQSWSNNFVAVTATPYDIANPSLNIVAQADSTTVTFKPTVAFAGGGGIPAAPAGTPFNVVLNKGQNLQISQTGDLTGSAIQTDKPVGFMAGQACMRYPQGVAYCDHGEQMVPPVRALGSEYVGVPYRPRVASETAVGWRVVGAVDGTVLTYSTPIAGAPTTLALGQSAFFSTGTPFVVSSQDKDHPFMIFEYMSGSQALSGGNGYGDPDFVLDVSPAQFLNDYVFFTDPTYPETNLVFVRAKDANGNFQDVNLDCLGNVTGWQDVGNYQWARVDLETGNFQNVGNCSTGSHKVDSTGPFGLFVWGWGTPLTSSFTSNVSYGYPGGMNIKTLSGTVVGTQ